MKKVPVLLFLVFCVYVSGVHSALGLPNDIPNVDAISKVFDGLVLVQPADFGNENVDRTGAIGVLKQIGYSMIDPFSALIFKLKLATITTSDPEAMFLDLNNQFEITSYAVYTATNALNSYSTLFRPTVYNDFISAFGNVSHSMDSYVPIEYQIQTGIESAAKANPPVTVSTITRYVTPDLINTAVDRLTVAVSACNNLTRVFRQALSLRDTAISYQAHTNQTIKTSISGINSLLVHENSTLDSTRISISHISKTCISIVNSTFAPIFSNNWNNGNLANLTSFLANFTTLVQKDFSQASDTGINYAKVKISAAVKNQISFLSQVIFNVSANISDTGSISSSPYAKSCVSRYNAKLASSPMSLSRLNACVKPNSGVFDVIDSLAQQTLSKIKRDAIETYDQLKLCTDRNGPCAASVFASFADQSNRTKVATTLAGKFISTSLIGIADRVSDCVMAVSADITSLAQSTQTRFYECLHNGS